MGPFGKSVAASEWAGSKVKAKSRLHHANLFILTLLLR
jgi:hypothetical protein